MKMYNNDFLIRIIGSSYDRNHMMEMDQFTHRLSGQETEVIERDSTESTATMKEDKRSTIIRCDNSQALFNT